MKRNFYNSLKMTIPATIISTAIGAINGYILSKWRFNGSEILFTCMLLGVFMPGQIALMPWAFILGKLGLTNTHGGPRAGPQVQGLSFTTLFCRNYYLNIPDDLIKAARIDGAGFWRIFRKNHPAAVAADPDRHGDLAVHRHLERVPLRRGLLVRPRAADHRGADRAHRPTAPPCATTT